MTEHITVCPECDTDYETTAQEVAMPLQRLDQQCPSCGEELTVGIVNYPDGRYVACGPPLPGEDCDEPQCHRSADYRTQWVGKPVSTTCSHHTLSLFESAQSL